MKPAGRAIGTLCLATALALGCGAGASPPAPAKAAPPAAPPVHDGPLTDYVAAAGLRWLVIGRPKEVASDASLAPAIELLLPKERLEAHSKSSGVDLRTLEAGLIAGFDHATLYAGSYPQRNGDRTGVWLEFGMRDGSRERTVVRASVSGTNASAVVEGPLGQTRKKCKEGRTMMDLIRWNPWNELAALRERMNRVFDDSLFSVRSPRRSPGHGYLAPAVDMFEKDDKVVIKAELPGLDKKDVSLDLQNGVQTLKGERKHENEVKEENFYRREMSYGKFVRSFSLPVDVDADQIKAEFQNGLLTVEVPKPEEHKPKQIKVN